MKRKKRKPLGSYRPGDVRFWDPQGRPAHGRSVGNLCTPETPCEVVNFRCLRGGGSRAWGNGAILHLRSSTGWKIVGHTNIGLCTSNKETWLRWLASGKFRDPREKLAITKNDVAMDQVRLDSMIESGVAKQDFIDRHAKRLRELLDKAKK